MQQQKQQQQHSGGQVGNASALLAAARTPDHEAEMQNTYTTMRTSCQEESEPLCKLVCGACTWHLLPCPACFVKLEKVAVAFYAPQLYEYY